MSPTPAPGRNPHPHYEILEQCGQGGMGVVYKALDKRLNRTVALKFLLDSRAGEDEAVKRFHREAGAIAALNHPNIATLYEVGEWDGARFLAMEYLHGGSLVTRTRPGGATYDELCRCAAELGGGLRFAHAKGILHRDVKPGNCMFSEHGVLKLVDFGLAKPSTAEDITHTGTSVGTVAYMAPELLRGEEATAKSDIYALGATLYELAAGRAMFSAKNLGSLVDQVLRSPPVPLSTLRPDLPVSFTRAVSRATTPAAVNRFDSVSDFLEQLRPSGSVNSSAPTLTIERTSTQVNPGRRKLVWVAAAVLGSIAIAAGVWFKTRSPTPAGQVLVVLPFENLGGDPANQPLCDGLQETVTGLLSMAGSSRNLLVVPSSEVRRGQVHTIADARRQFKADLALTGSAQRTPDRLQLTLNLDDAVSLRQKDSRIISVAISETADLQGKLSEELVSFFGYGSPARTASRPPGDTTSSSAAYSLYLEGTGAVEQRHPDAAIGFLQKALQADAGFALARAKLAEAYLWKNTFTSDPKWLALADEEVNRAARRGSGHETLMARAMIRQATGDYNAAIPLFRQILKGEPDNMEAYQLLAQALASANRGAEAEAVFRQAIRLRPGYWPMHNMLGLFYMDQHNYSGAEQELSSAAALAPRVGLIYSNLGALYFAMNRWPEAAASFEKSLAIEQEPLAQANLGTVYFYQGKYEESAKHARIATELQPANPVNWGNLGDALWQIPAEKAAASEAFEHAALLSSEQLSINPANFRLRKSYALYLAKIGRRQEALAQIDMALSQAPNDLYVQFYAARVFSVLNEMDRALTALDMCKKLGYSRNEIEREPDLAAIARERNKDK
jgi:serine/threonine protein kinase/tetratricopeptide (TPR) repeat protein